jgi:hypothetical protein
MKRIFILSILAISFSSINAQINTSSNYQTAVGLKIYPGAITVKHFLNGSNKAIEGLGYFWQYGFTLTGLYEIHGDINGAEGLKWYIGPGAHIGFYNESWTKDYPSRSSGFNMGVDGVLGLDYKIKGAPINVSIDWQPYFNIINYTYFEAGWGGLGVRYTF